MARVVRATSRLPAHTTTSLESGRIAGGRYIVYPGDTTPLTNLYLTMLDKVGVPTEKLGDSTGKLNRLEV